MAPDVGIPMRHREVNEDIIESAVAPASLPGDRFFTLLRVPAAQREGMFPRLTGKRETRAEAQSRGEGGITRARSTTGSARFGRASAGLARVPPLPIFDFILQSSMFEICPCYEASKGTGKRDFDHGLPKHCFPARLWCLGAYRRHWL